MPAAHPVPALNRLRSVLPELRRDFPLGRMALFGSVARGDARPDSDVYI
ncbi:nucleotidyltransferase family protein [Prosthecobacter sp.]